MRRPRFVRYSESARLQSSGGICLPGESAPARCNEERVTGATNDKQKAEYLRNSGDEVVQLLRQPRQKAVTLRRIWSVIDQLILLCIAGMVLPAAAAGQTSLALEPGWYGWSQGYPNSPVPPFYNGPDWSVVWQDSYVYDYPPEAGNLYWYARITYRNISNRKLTISCRQPDNTRTPVREHMQGTPNAGYVDASETFCTRYPGWSAILSPGDIYNDWAIFHNVPWNVPGSSEVSIEWQPYGSTPWVFPWKTGPFSTLGGTLLVCPPELVTLRTCTPPAIPTRQLGADEEEFLANFALCETDLLSALGLVATTATLGPIVGGVVAGAEIASKITDIMAAGQASLTVIAIKQDPKNLNNYVELILEFAPGASCAKIAQGGANKTVIAPLINAVTRSKG